MEESHRLWRQVKEDTKGARNRSKNHIWGRSSRRTAIGKTLKWVKEDKLKMSCVWVEETWVGWKYVWEGFLVFLWVLGFTFVLKLSHCLRSIVTCDFNIKRRPKDRSHTFDKRVFIASTIGVYNIMYMWFNNSLEKHYNGSNCSIQVFYQLIQQAPKWFTYFSQFCHRCSPKG